MIKQVSDLFKGHNDLILGFNTFLPADQRIKPETLEQMERERNERERVAAAGGRGMQSAQHGKQAEMYVEVPPKQRYHSAAAAPFRTLFNAFSRTLFSDLVALH